MLLLETNMLSLRRLPCLIISNFEELVCSGQIEVG